MICYRTEIDVPKLKGKQISDFMVQCTDTLYQNWWPGTHIAYHQLKTNPNSVGSIYCFEEFIGPYRLRFRARLSACIHGQLLEWQLMKGILLPAKLSLSFVDTASGTHLTHQLSIGFRGVGKLLDAVIKAFIPKGLESLLDDHAKHEFTVLSQRIG